MGGIGANRNDIGYGSQPVRQHTRIVGSRRYIDWILVDKESVMGSPGGGAPRVTVKHVQVHTAPGTMNIEGSSSGYGSDHFPVSTDVILLVRRHRMEPVRMQQQQQQQQQQAECT